MKKLRTRILMLLIAVVMAFTTFVGLPTVPASYGTYAATTMQNASAPWLNAELGYVFDVKGIQLKGTVGEKVYIKKATVTHTNGDAIDTNTTKVVAVVRDHLNRPLTAIEIKNDSTTENPDLDDYFEPKNTGLYKIYYSVQVNDIEVARSENYEIDIIGASYSLKTVSNQRFIDAAGKDVFAFLPEQTSSDVTFTLPVLDVVDEWGEKVDNQFASVEIILAGESLYKYVPGQALPTMTSDQKQKLTVTPSTGYTLSDGTSVQTFAVKTEQVGLYKVIYTYAENAGDIEVPLIFDVRSYPASTFKPTNKDNMDLVADLAGTGAVNTASLGEEVIMTEPKVVNRKDSSTPLVYYTKMEVVHVVGNQEFSLDDTPVLNKRTNISDTFSFTPNKTGTYRVYYQVFDAYGNKSNEGAWGIFEVFDDKGPTISFVEDYELDANKNLKDGEVITDGKYILPYQVKANEFFGQSSPSISGYTGTFRGMITVPAIYAEDSVSELKDITLKRELIWQPSNLDDKLTPIPNSSAISLNTINVELLWKAQNPGSEYPGENKAVTIFVEKLGEYRVRYSATEKYLSQATGQLEDRTRTEYFSPNVLVSENVASQPLPAINSNVTLGAKPGEIYSFLNPTAISDDAHLKIETYYYYADTENAAMTALITDGKADYKQISDLTKTLAKPTHLKRETKGEEDLNNYYIDVQPGDKRNLYIVVVATDYVNRQMANSAAANGLASVRVRELPLYDEPVTNAVKVKTNGITAVARPTNALNYDELGYYVGSSGAGGKTNFIYNAHQNRTVYLPKVEFESDDSALIRNIVIYRVVDGNFIEPTSARIEDGDTSTTLAAGGIYTYALSGKFIPPEAGQYLVTYTARDRANNISNVTFDLWVKSTVAPSVGRPESIPDTMELGETKNLKPFDIPIKDNGQDYYISRNELTLTVDTGTTETGVNPTENGIDFVTGNFTPVQIGIYKFKLSYTSPSGLTGSYSFSITVSDTQAPVVSTQQENILISRIKSIGPDALVKVGDSYAPIIIPNISATDKSGTVNYSISIKKDSTTNVPYALVRGDGTTVDADLKAEKENVAGSVNGDDIWFKPIGSHPDGKYEIIYEMRDKYNNSTGDKYKYTIILGDITSPEIEFLSDYKEQNLPTGTHELDKNGEFKLEINLKGITASDDSGKFALENAVGGEDEDAIDYYDFKKPTITLLRNGNETITVPVDDNGIIRITLTRTGTYTLTYKVTDLAGNPFDVFTEFEIVAKEGKTTFSTVFVGVALTILALCGLGVAVFFALKDPKKTDKKPKNKKPSDDEGKIVV